jgi:CTP synthase
MDSYISIIEAIKHACWVHNRKAEIKWISSEKYEQFPSKIKELKNYDGIIIPGGFGKRGTKGKLKAIEFCRKEKIPFLGLCLGMQLAIIEFAKNVCGLKEADSAEFSPKCKTPIINVMAAQKDILKEKKYGATMRLGIYKCNLKKGTNTAEFYDNKRHVLERHRHRYELNNDYRQVLEKNGMTMAGINPDKDLVEIIELKDHEFFVATQFHPEYKSRPLNPHPLFKGFIKACIN